MGEKIGVVVVNYASHRLIQQNLGDLTDADLRIVVVDNFCSDRERLEVAALAESRGWTWVPNPNSGFGGGANTGVATALAEGCGAVVVVNPDLEIDAPSVRRLAAEALDHPMTIVAPLVLGRDGLPWGQLGYVDVEQGRIRSKGGSAADLSWVSGACLALSADTWTQLGGFSCDYFMYWEDVDLSVRCQRAGGSVMLLEDVTVTHAVGGTQGEGRSRLYYFYNCRNRLLFAAKHLSRRQRLRWLAQTPADLRRVARRDAGLSRWNRAMRALPPCLSGVAAGAGLMIAAALRHEGPSR